MTILMLNHHVLVASSCESLLLLFREAPQALALRLHAGQSLLARSRGGLETAKYLEKP